MYFMPAAAPVVVLAFIGTGALLALALISLGWLLLTRRFGPMRLVLIPTVTLTAMYTGAMGASSLLSRDRLLEPGEEKYFCELDCHLAYSVTNVENATTLGTDQERVTPTGQFWIVTVRTRFDENTISSRRPRSAPLTPGSRQVRLVGFDGRSWAPSYIAPDLLGGSTPFTTPLRPGESYETRLVFDVPAEMSEARLLLTDAFPESSVLIGHERSPGHGKVYFALTPQH